MAKRSTTKAKKKPLHPLKGAVVDAIKRVSEKGDREEGYDFVSPEFQEQRMYADAERFGYTIRKVHDETDSVSGSTTNRVGLQAAMDAALSGEVDGIVVARVDRFARNAGEGLVEIKRLTDAGKLFIAVEDNIRGDHASSPQGKLYLGFLLQIAEWQLESLTAAWDAAVKDHIEKGIAHTEPYGYRRDVAPLGTPKGERKNYSRRLLPDESTARWVRFIFEQRALGTGWNGIAAELMTRGVPSPTGAAFWHHSVVSRIVSNRSYLGEIRNGDYENLAAHEPLVGLDLWARCERQRGTTPTRSEHPHELAGLVRCAGCGHRMRQSPNGQGGEYYQCRRKFPWGRCPAPASAEAETLERYVTRHYAEHFVKFMAGARVSTAVLAEAQQRLQEAEAELHYWVTSPAVAAMRLALGDAYFEEGQRVRTQAVIDARRAVTEAQAAALGAEVPKDLLTMWDSPEMTSTLKRYYFSLAYGVIAVRRAVSYREPVGDRVRIWFRNEPGAPDNLPGQGGAIGPDARPVPIVVDEPAGAGEP
jgi:DNA invertase Pin-like site-specific DNA recombinase